jgi:N-acetylglucosamine kinase-like BadF-type ATPase
MRYVLGVDGGGSKTICIAADETGQLLGSGKGGSVNSNYVLRREVISSLRDAIKECLSRTRLKGEEVDLVCMSAPITPDLVDIVTQELGLGRILRAAEGATPRWAARYSVEGYVGLTVDAGTGAMARGWSRDGREAGASGWGATLGDEGSSYWIGIEAMRAVLRAFDGRTKPTMLEKPVLDYLGLTSVQELVLRVDQSFVRERTGSSRTLLAPDSGAESPESVGGIFFHEEFEGGRAMQRHEIARLGPVVAEVASWGDWSAKEIFRKAGEELGLAGVAIIRRLEMEQEEFVVVPFGGVFRAGELILGAFRNTIQQIAPKARIVQPSFEPAVGAVLMALDGIGVQINETIIRTVASSSAEIGSSESRQPRSQE